MTHLLLEDLSIVFERLPQWLVELERGDGVVELPFASQGTELKLIAIEAAASAA